MNPFTIVQGYRGPLSPVGVYEAAAVSWHMCYEADRTLNPFEQHSADLQVDLNSKLSICPAVTPLNMAHQSPCKRESSFPPLRRNCCAAEEPALHWWLCWKRTISLALSFAEQAKPIRPRWSEAKIIKVSHTCATLNTSVTEHVVLCSIFGSRASLVKCFFLYLLGHL